MGELIDLAFRQADRARLAPGAAPAFCFALTCPLSYLAAERLERGLGEVTWIPVAGECFAPLSGADRLRAEHLASELRLPIIWPDRAGRPAPAAFRAAAWACEQPGDTGARFVLAALRLSFCGGCDIEDPEVLAEAASAANASVEACLAAAADRSRDLGLRATAEGLRRRGVERLPAVRLGSRLLHGPAVAAEAAALRAWRAAGPAPAG